MNRICTIIFCLLSFGAKAQIGFINTITFEPSSLSSWIDYRPYIIIDSDLSHNSWQIGKPDKTVFTSANSLPNAIVTDTVGHYQANDTSVFIFKIPGYYIDPPYSFASLKFSYQLDVDSGDIARVEVSEDSGHHWTNLMDSLPNGFSWYAHDTPNLSISTTGWRNFHLDSWSVPFVDTILFRFTFISDSVDSTRDGWIIDDIEFQYMWEGLVSSVQNPNLISIYPNPSKGNIYIHTTKQYADAMIAVYNTLGQEVYHTESPPQNGYLNLPLQSGTYTLKYSGGDEYCVKSIVIAR